MGFTLGRARRGNPCQSVFKLTGSQWPSHTSVRTVRSAAKWIVMSVITPILHWPLMASPLTWVSGSMLSGMVICCFSWHSTQRLPETEKYMRLRFTSPLLLCPRPGRQEVNYCRLNEFVNNAFRPTPELYCKRNFLEIIARLAQLMIQIVANCDKSCQFLDLPET